MSPTSYTYYMFLEGNFCPCSNCSQLSLTAVQMERSGWGFWPLTLLTQWESSLSLLAVFVVIKRLYQKLFCPVYSRRLETLRNARSVLLAYNHRASLPSHCPATSLLFHVPRDGALGQGWQNGVIILALAPAHALPLIHFTASLLAPEGEIDHVGEKERAIGREVSSPVILPVPTSSPSLPPLVPIYCSLMVY